MSLNMAVGNQSVTTSSIQWLISWSSIQLKLLVTRHCIVGCYKLKVPLHHKKVTPNFASKNNFD